MKLSAAHAFRKWHDGYITPLQEQIISALEQRRLSHGRIRAVVNAPEPLREEVEFILLRYVHYLHHTFRPFGRIMVVDNYAAHARARYGGCDRQVRDDVKFCSASRNARTRGLGTFDAAIAFRMDGYCRRMPGDPRTSDILTNFIAIVPDVPATAVFFVGTYRPRSRRAFARYWRFMQRQGDSAPYLLIDATNPPPLKTIRPRHRKHVRIYDPDAPLGQRAVGPQGGEMRAQLIITSQQPAQKSARVCA